MLFFAEHILKKKWKYLRDQYSIELSKITRPKSGSGANEVTVSKWQYFTALSFLKGIVKPRQSSGNCSSQGGVEDAVDEDVHTCTDTVANVEEVIQDLGNQDDLTEYNKDLSFDSHDQSTLADHPSDTTSQQDTTQCAKKFKNHTVERIKRKRNDDYTSELLQIERKELDMLIQTRSAKGEKDTENDEHLLFFKTLLPHVRKISPHQIIPFRTQIQDVVQRFAYPMNYQMLSPSESTILSASSASHMAESPSLLDYDTTQQSSRNEEFPGMCQFLQLK